ncbi:fructosamine kinase family protein [Xylocopilactobacillus apis]|uniref:Fructosamine-3-kinase n=1 Tax=Xylocopilactobacillus apis TaxID=2932183 RepID=A0AAU9DMX8_9LACO|nr:fructosamine kinase family protein [Xylocopilactobacillus apis]BDR56273.1 fructosamine-3-kinase [Xylocopilactobacillus apis]
MNERWLYELPISDIKRCIPVTGGDVNQAYRVITSNCDYFLLVQPQSNINFYEGEIAGLSLFEQIGIQAPRVIAHGQIMGDSYLLLNYLKKGFGKQSDLGKIVAQLHHYNSPNNRYGFNVKYQGSEMAFDNSWTDTWSEIFIDRRLDPLSEMIGSKNLWAKNDFDQYRKAREIINESLKQHKSKPSLLHGDLWGGNYMFLEDGSPALIDPACFYGDREFDVGITTVFGGFSKDFYESYQESYPLDEGFNLRINFYRLYYLMVHLNKFGSIYASSVNTVMQKILAKK